MVTILMPVYNGADYIKIAIDSILAQTYANFNLLIINDGSTDATQTIIDSYSDSRIVSVKQKNMGVSRTLNKGLELIETPYLRRHDADDFSEPWMLQKQMDFLEQNPTIQFVSTMCAFMTDNGKVARDYTQPKRHIFGSEDYILVKRSHFNPYSPIVHGTVLGPTKIFKEMNGYRTEFLTSEDNDLWLRIIEKYKFAVLKCCPYYLRLSSTSATSVYGSYLGFYRELAYQMADERATRGTDLLQRGETIPEPKKNKSFDPPKSGKGQNQRADLLDFQYKVMLNAKDYKNVLKIIKLALRDGYKVPDTYKGIIFPLLGDSLISLGVKVKSVFK